MLYITVIEGAKIGEMARWHQELGSRIVRECFYPMQTPEAVTAVASSVDRMRTTAPGIRLVRESEVRAVDAAFWKVFDFRFLDGNPFTEDMFRSARPVAVVSARLARAFFGRTDVAGETLNLDFADYTILGVVDNVSEAVGEAYSEVWIPYTLHSGIMHSDGAEGICNRLNLYLLARQTADFDSIRQECRQRLDVFNAGQKEWLANIWSQPLSGVQLMFYHAPQERMRGLFSGMLMLAALFFVLPVCNLLGIVFSQMQKRRPEIGLRKAFGAGNGDIVRMVLRENLVITLSGGVAGLLLSFLFFYLAKDSLLERSDVSLDAGMFMQPLVFLAAIGTCLLINLTASGVPAWRMAHMAITDSLNNLPDKS
jgi:putative ABC transport system permease protein